MMQHLLFSQHRQSLDSDLCLLYEHALIFHAREHRALCVTTICILKSNKIEAEDSQIHFFSLLET